MSAALDFDAAFVFTREVGWHLSASPGLEERVRGAQRGKRQSSRSRVRTVAEVREVVARLDRELLKAQGYSTAYVAARGGRA